MLKRRMGRETLIALLLFATVAPVRAAGTPAGMAGLNEYGVSMALARQVPRAESSFVSLLSQHRGDARALNNLGNLSLMKGELAVALSFYDAALRSDSADAGVRLNRAATYMLMGDQVQAEDEASRAVQMAGGRDRAGALLGLREAAVDSSRGAEKKFLSQAEMRELLRKASQSVPTGTARPRQVQNSERGQGKRMPQWRSGSTRAAERPGDGTEAATVLYWKR